MEVEASKFDLAYIKLDGNIGCMVNGAAWRWRRWTSSSSTAPSPPFCDVGGGASKEKVTAALKSSCPRR